MPKWYSVRLRLLQLLLCIGSLGVVPADIRPTQRLSPMVGEGFIAYLQVAKDFGSVHKCWFRYANTERQLLELNASEPLVTSRGELVLPYSSSVCGVRVSKIGLHSDGVWTLETQNVDGGIEQDQVLVSTIAAQPTQLDTHVVRELGYGTVACTRSDTLTKGCEIIETDTNKTWPQCELTTIMRANRSFLCRTFNLGRMSQTEEHITVEIINSVAYANATQNETDKHLVLGCKLAEKPYYCYAEFPERQKALYIGNGLYNERYSVHETLLDNSHCALELQKPLSPSEMGLWRIYSHRTDSTTGCLYYVGAAREQIIASELQRLSAATRVIEAFAELTHLDELSCMVPFVVDDCYLRDPNNTVYFPSKQDFRRTAPFGKCVFRQLARIAGTWICGARGAGYDKEVLQDIEVVVESKAGQTLTPTVKARRSENVELMCRSAFEAPITRCVYIDPHNQVHLVASVSSQKTSGHVHYHGRGLQYGECGIKIEAVTTDDFGLWRCQFGGASFASDSSFAMTLKPSAIANATSVGLGIGLTVMIALIAGVVVGTIFYRRRNLTAQHNFAAAGPLEELHVPEHVAAGIGNKNTTNAITSASYL